MNREESSRILREMTVILDNRQMLHLNKVLEEIIASGEGEVLKPSRELLENYIATKRLEGRGRGIIINTISSVMLLGSSMKTAHSSAATAMTSGASLPGSRAM